MANWRLSGPGSRRPLLRMATPLGVPFSNSSKRCWVQSLVPCAREAQQARATNTGRNRSFIDNKLQDTAEPGIHFRRKTEEVEIFASFASRASPDKARKRGRWSAMGAVPRALIMGTFPQMPFSRYNPTVSTRQFSPGFMEMDTEIRARSVQVRSERVKRRWGQALAMAALCVSSAVWAQDAEQVAQITKAMPAESQMVIQRLGELDHLDAGEWKFHAGDVPHGESVSLDDSDWQTVKPGFRASGEAAWFRRWVEVPKTLHGYDLTDTRIWFRFEAYANGPMPQIIYFNGSRVALGDDLEPIVLLDHAKPGQKVLIAVKLLQTVDQKTFHNADFKIDFSESRPNPDDLRKEFLSAALLVPSLSTNPQGDEATLEKAVHAVDLKALDAADQAKFDASLKQASSDLEALKPLLKGATFHLTGNSHIDAAWLCPWTETVDVVKR